MKDVCWVDGRLAPREAPVVRADDSAFAEGRGCYTSLRVAGGVPRFAARQARRLARDAARLGLGEVDPARVRRAFEELAAAACDDGEGILRLQASRDAAGALHLVGVPRSLGPDPDTWRAVLAPFPHAGATPWAGAKVTNRLELALAARAARAAGADEALLADREGRLVEGSRSNLCAATAAGAWITPPASRGAVSGVALEIVRERVPALVERDIAVARLGELRELVAINSVRGARPVTHCDGRPIGDARPGPLAARLAAALATADAGEPGGLA